MGLRKFWLGQVGLSISFWLYGVVGSCLVAWLCLMLIPESGVPSYLELFAICVATIAYQTLVTIGVWRSASTYLGSPIYAYAAKGVVAVYAALVIATVGQMAYMFLLLFGLLLNPPFIK